MINQKDNRSVKDITGRDVFIGDKIVMPFKMNDYIYYQSVNKLMFEVVGFTDKRNGVKYTHSEDNKVRVCNTSFVKVESRDDREQAER